MSEKTYVMGFPRIGEQRELKKYWSVFGRNSAISLK